MEYRWCKAKCACVDVDKTIYQSWLGVRCHTSTLGTLGCARIACIGVR
nr:MAG TPA: hypothetical protein [Caudoviricetes sp.]